MGKKLCLLAAIGAAFFIFLPGTILSHPGNTASDGCHYCRTNCDYWGVEWNERHCHTGYTVPAPTYVAPKPVVTTGTDIKSVDVDFQTEYVDDPSLDVGKEIVKTEGVKGKKVTTYTVTYTDGVETNRMISKEEVIPKPINRIISRGTKSRQTTPTTDNQAGGTKGNTQVAGSATDALLGLGIFAGFIAGIVYFVKWLVKIATKK